MDQQKVMLCILDGWGINPRRSDGDATLCAPYFWKLLKTFPHTYLNASGQFVGLPSGQIGNSEVGHMTMGLGRILKQDLCRIDEALQKQILFTNPIFQNFINPLKRSNGTCHVLGLLSPGGVHSHMNHMLEIVNHLADSGIQILVHAILDGRDAPPKSAQKFLAFFESHLHPRARIVSICGRFFAMDRDQRWDRTATAYHLIAEQKSEEAEETCDQALQKFYQKGITDEFIPATRIGPPYIRSKNDRLMMTNYRSDRARQIVDALGNPKFSKFERLDFHPFDALLSMTAYDETFQSFCSPLFAKEPLNNSLGAVISRHGEKQVRIAETEKYAHITFFFNGGLESPFPGEERILIASPKVQTYDLTPEMSAREITEKTIQVITEQKTDFLMVNFANSDMLGHTGNLKAAQESIRFIDLCLRKVTEAAQQNNFLLLITADHGNAEQMLNEDGSPNTAHTTNLVPFILINAPKGMELISDDASYGQSAQGLADVAPTILTALGLAVPGEMTGHTLIKRI